MHDEVGGGGTLHPEKHENRHISVENCHTVMIQVSADSKFHALQLCFYNASSKIDISTPKQQFRENACAFISFHLAQAVLGVMLQGFCT